MDRGVIAVVPARAGSVRLPGKNVRPLAGRPMIAWTLLAAQAARTLDRVVVSTDDPEVAAVAEAMGMGPVVRRPDRLAGAEASVIDAVEHALEAVGGDWSTVVLLQPTSPLRLANDVDGAVDLFRRTGAPSVVSVSPLAKPVAFHVAVDGEGGLSPAAEGLGSIRLVNGSVYVARPADLFAARSFLMPGARAFEMPADRGWDVDTESEFAACEAALAARGDRLL